MVYFMVTIRISTLATLLAAAIVGSSLPTSAIVTPARADVVTVGVDPTGTLTFTVGGEPSYSDGYAGTYTYDVTINKGPPGTITITQISEPKPRTDGWYAIIPVTVDPSGYYYTFDAKKVPYYESNGKEHGTGSFKGSFFGDDLDFTYSDSMFSTHVWTFVSVPEPSTGAMMLLGFAGLSFAGSGYRRAGRKNATSIATGR
jgi:hypothetical protein